MNYDKIISDLFFEKDWKIKRNIRLKFDYGFRKYNKYTNINNYLINRFNDYDSLKEILYRIRHNIEERPVCKRCGKRVGFVGKGGIFFREYCSVSCKSKEQDKTKSILGQRKYNLEHYGVEHNFQREEFKQKRLQTLIEHYGENPMSNPKIINKTKQTCLERYGVTNAFFLEKCIAAKDRYYHTNAGKIASKPENQAYELFKEKFPDVKRQYKSKEYPYRCDFYIPSLDLYIECHYSQYHHGKPFDANNPDHLKELEILKDKSEKRKALTGKDKTQYDKIIYTWTELDPKKLEIAKQNNLNFVTLYNIKQTKDFVNSYK